MAGSRLERFGTVYSRVRDLLCSGVISNKPVWYDVYNAFPPKQRPPELNQSTRGPDTVPHIFYQEDEIRARFYEEYGSGSWPHDLSKSHSVSTCQRFVDKYAAAQSSGVTEPSALLEEAGRALLSEGVLLKKVQQGRVSPVTHS